MNKGKQSTDNNIREWLRKENVFDNDILKLLLEYGVINAPYDLRIITQNKWDQLFRKGLAEKSKELKSQTAKNRFEKKLKKIEKLWKKERKKNDNNETENESKQIESIEPIKQQKELTKSTANWNKEFAEQKVEMQNQIDKKYQKTVSEKKSKQIANANQSNNLRQWLRKEDVFDSYLLEVLGDKYHIYNPPKDFGKISQNEWTKIFRNIMAEKTKELKSTKARNNFEKKLRKIEKIWRKQPKISKSKQLKEESKENAENEENKLQQSESDITLSKTVIAKESNEVTIFLKAIKMEKYCKNFTDRGFVRMIDLENFDHDYLHDTIIITDYGDQRIIMRGIKEKFERNHEMNIFIAIETGDFKMLQTVQEYHIRNVFSTKKGSVNGLHYCCTYERPKMLKFLLENNMKLVTKINDQNFLGNTAAFIAIITMSEYKNKWSDYSFECLKILVEWKCKNIMDLNIANLKGRTILMHTALHNQIEVMQYLLALETKDNCMRINMEIQDKQKQTAIMYAVKHSNFESVMILCAYGARCDVKTLRGTMATDYASGNIKMFIDIQGCMNGLKSVRDIKMKKGINIPMELIYIIMYYACDMGKHDISMLGTANAQKKFEKQNSKGNGKKQKRKEVRHTGARTGGDYKGWFAFG